MYSEVVSEEVQLLFMTFPWEGWPEQQ